MDDFVYNKLKEWGLSEWIYRFKDEGIDEESFYCLDDQDLKHLITKIGPRARFKKRFKLLKGEQNTTQERNDDSVQVFPLTRERCRSAITKPDLDGESSGWESPAKRQRDEGIDEESFKKRLELLKGERNTTQERNDVSVQEHEEEAELPQGFPLTRERCSSAITKPDLHGESSGWESPAKRQRVTEEVILSDLKSIMKSVQLKLHNQHNTNLNTFLKKKIKDLETDKRELVGVFGKSGAGKSSLINAIIGEKDLLPTGSISACTMVMIKVEANMRNLKYEGDIEFITKEEWREELRPLDQLRGDNANQGKGGGGGGGDDDDIYDFAKKLSALYGEGYKNKTSEELMDKKYFKEIPEFLDSSRKTFTCQSATELSEQLVKYTRSESEEGEGEEVKKMYWPLVKCVTVKVPQNEFLQHVTLVDLPGNGDYNKSRDKMWKETVRDCSTVWTVTDINRAESEPEAWEILENASSLMGNGGECQQIHFICTKSDQIGDVDDHSAADVHARILKRNELAKKKVETKFKNQKKIQKQFSDDCFEVFTVSSKEFLKGKYLQPDETEIPRLQKFLRDLNDHHSETLNYVSGAYGILSLIQWCRPREEVDSKTNVCEDLKKNMNDQLVKVKTTMEEANEAFEKCLSEGVEKSKRYCKVELKSFFSSKYVSAFHKILKCVVEKGGVHKPKEGTLINLNMMLSSHLTDSIDEEFKKTFPNNREREPFNGVIGMRSLVTDKLIQKYKDVKFQLDFLKTEEEKMKTKLKSIIRHRKKIIYNSLTDTIEMDMEECYKKAAGFTGKGSLENMIDTILEHVEDSKDVMFDHAKNVMLEKLKQLKEDILKELETAMMKAIADSLNKDDSSIIDVSAELAEVMKRYKDLKAQKKKYN